MSVASIRVRRRSTARARVLAAAVLVAALLVGTETVLGESTVTPQAQAINGAFMERLPPPAGPPTVCVIDSGTDLTADTTAAVILRKSVLADPALDDAVGGAGHGTSVVAAMAAPRNGVGSVGLWSHVRVISYRAVGSDGGFQWADYVRAITDCRKQPNVVAMNLSFGTTNPYGQLFYDPYFLDEVTASRNAGISVVAAAGNLPGPLLFPAASPGVVAVAAGQGMGANLCAFASSAPGVLAAPGCPVEVSGRADAVGLADGSSFAAPLVTTLLAAIRSYRPDLSRQAVEDLVRATARSAPDGSMAVDAEAAFNAAGLTEAIAQAKSAANAQTPSPGPVAVATAATTTPKAERPRPIRVLSVKRRNGFVFVRILRPPTGTRLILRGGPAVRSTSRIIRAKQTRRRWILTVGVRSRNGLSTPRSIVVPARRIAR